MKETKNKVKEIANKLDPDKRFCKFCREYKDKSKFSSHDKNGTVVLSDMYIHCYKTMEIVTDPLNI